MKPVGFFKAVGLAFAHYADFSGRSRRSEYWWFTLFNYLVSAVMTTCIPDLAWLWMLAVLVPGLSLVVRRLHDVGKSGWYYLWMLVPVVGWIMVLVQLCKDSTVHNQWGPNTKI